MKSVIIPYYNSNPKGNIIWLDSSMPDFNFRNNIFIYDGLFLFEGHHFKHEIFQDNVYRNLSGGFRIEEYIKYRGMGKNNRK